jgi:hypothetical protein
MVPLQPERKTFEQKWDELEDIPSVAFTVTIRGRFHPSIAANTKIQFDWFSGDGKELNSPQEAGGNLESWTKNEGQSTSHELFAEWTNEFGAFSSSLELCKLLQSGALEAKLVYNDVEVLFIIAETQFSGRVQNTVYCFSPFAVGGKRIFS